MNCRMAKNRSVFLATGLVLTFTFERERERLKTRVMDDYYIAFPLCPLLFDT